MDYIVDNRAGILPKEKEKSVAELIESRINEAISKNKKFSLKIGVGFFFFEGFLRIYPRLKELYDRGLLEEFRVIMGSETTFETKEILKAIKYDASKLEDESYNFLKELYNKGIFKIRVFKDRKFHLKIYLINIGGQTEVWGGSANFTYGGLEDNIELLVPLGTSSIDDIKLFETFYENLWNKSSEDIEGLKVIDIVEKGYIEIGKAPIIYLEPREFFLRLIKVWGKEYLLKEAKSKEYFRLAEFQKMSLDLVRYRLNNFGGCILANSVGLGKTEIASYLIKEHVEENKKVLIILPPRLKNHWKKVLKNYVDNFNNITFLSIGMLRKSHFNYIN